MKALLSALLCAVSLGACTRIEPALSYSEEKALYFSAKTETTVDWEKNAWIERVAKLLRGGRGLDPKNPAKNLAALAEMDKSAIIDLLMEDPLFGDAVLDFNLYFLGGKPDQLFSTGHKKYSQEIFDYPQAISSAQEAIKKGDYLKLLDYNQPVYIDSLALPFLDQGDQNLSPYDVRKKIYNRIREIVEGMIQWTRKNPAVSVADFCGKFSENNAGSDLFANLGLPVNLRIKAVLSQEWYGRLQLACSTRDFVKVDFLAELEKIKQKNEILFERLANYESDQYAMRDVSDIRLINLGGLVQSLEWTQFGFTQVRALVNSSTNYNRKRAAYVLKRFFCDDLTPIAVENPIEHAQDRHGTDASCLSCHYKLDPMAGFFKDLGIFFGDFSRSKKILFDDMATADLETYQYSWRASPDAPRAWNIGYIRSVNQTKLNDYGETIEDLFAIIRNAPETRACLVRRMFEYFAGTDRMLDTGYLDYLTQGFNAAVAQDASADGLKATIKQILLSNSFAQTDPTPGECYDFAPGTDPANRPPCAVAFVIQQNCIKCHGSAETGKGGLDLAHWTKQEDGRFGFSFVDDDSKQRPREEAFAAIVERLTTSDSDDRMPKGSYMSAADRERLYLWALKELGQ